VSNIVAELAIDVSANTASFDSSMDKVVGSAQKGAQGIQSAFDSQDFSMREARGGLMILEEEFGVRLPRELNTLIAQIPGVGAAFEAMLPVIGVVAAITVIGTLIDKHNALALAMSKAAEEAANLKGKEAERLDGLELTNLKLEDTIAKFEGRPEENKLKEAFLEAAIAADKLGTEITAEFSTMNKAIQGTQGFMTTFGALMEQSLTHFNSGNLVTEMGNIHKAVDDTSKKLDAVNIAKGELFSVKNDDWTGLLSAYAKLTAKTTDFAEAAITARNIVMQTTPDQVSLIAELSNEWASARSALQQYGVEVEIIHNKHTVGKEDPNQTSDALRKDAEAQSEADKLAKDAAAAFNKQLLDGRNAADLAVAENYEAAAQKMHLVDIDFFQKKEDLIADDERDALAALKQTSDAEHDALVDKQNDLLTYDPAKNVAAIITVSAQIEVQEVDHQTKMLAIEQKAAADKLKVRNEGIAAQVASIEFQEEAQKKLNDEDAHSTLALGALKVANTKAVYEEQAKLGIISAQDKLHKDEQAALDEVNLARATAAHLVATAPDSNEDHGGALAKAKALATLAEAEAKFHNQMALYDQEDIKALTAEMNAVGTSAAQKEGDFGKIHELQMQAIKDLDTQLLKTNSLENGSKAFFNEYMNDGTTAATKVTDLMKTGLSGIESELATFAVTGKASWDKLIQGIETDIAKLAINSAFKQLFGLLSSSAPGAGGIGGMLSSFFGGGKAGGGDVNPGSLYAVGESGTELFSPSVAGTIIPNSAITQAKASGGRAMVVHNHFNISTPNADSFRASQDQMSATAMAGAMRAAKRNG